MVDVAQNTVDQVFDDPHFEGKPTPEEVCEVWREEGKIRAIKFLRNRTPGLTNLKHAKNMVQSMIREVSNPPFEKE